MSTISVRVKHEFSAGHRILGFSGAAEKCRNIHGHDYTCWWMFETTLEWPPRVEFGAVKAGLRRMIDERMDHAFIVHQDDDFLAYLTHHDLKRYALRDRPTTEIARLTQQHFGHLELVYVQLREGSNNEAVCIVKDREPMLRSAPDDPMISALRVERAATTV